MDAKEGRELMRRNLCANKDLEYFNYLVLDRGFCFVDSKSRGIKVYGNEVA